MVQTIQPLSMVDKTMQKYEKLQYAMAMDINME